ncbi:MAG: hypothetical protein M1838_001890 [Thelocarpon superellum]|nr:MAG: hypothetical protein M1838_001890 [Thelocarpon superellum]
MSCPNCFSGHVREGAAAGRKTTLYGLPTYVAEPRDGRAVTGVVVIVPDAYGWQFVNNRILADHYADCGEWRVLLPEFMMVRLCLRLLKVGIVVACGLKLSVLLSIESPQLTLPHPTSYHVFCALYGFVPHLISNRLGVTLPKVVTYMRALRTAEPRLPIGAAGFCWGGRHVFYLARPESLPPDTTTATTSPSGSARPLVDALFAGHPSAVEAPAKLQGIKVPLAVAVGTDDMVFTPPQQAIVQRELKDAEVECEMRFYEGAGHEFCVRADPADKEVEKHCAEGESQAVEWF